MNGGGGGGGGEKIYSPPVGQFSQNDFCFTSTMIVKLSDF